MPPRKSARLLANGYYRKNEPDSSVANVSYHKKPVKVFKKKERPRTPSHCGATQPISYTPPIPEAQSYVRNGALDPYDTRVISTSRVRSSSTTGSNQTGITHIHTTSGAREFISALTSGFMSKIRRAFFFLMTLLSSMADRAQSMMHLEALVNNSASRHMKKTFVLLLILVLIFLCVWLLFPLLNPFASNTIHHAAVEEPIHLDLNSRLLLEKAFAGLTSKLSSLADRIKAVEIKNEEKTVLEQGGFVLDVKGSDHIADKMADFALETQGARVITSRCSETYGSSRTFFTLWGFPILSPQTVIQGHASPLPGRCWSFPGAQGTLAISLSHSVRITHVTVDHLPSYNSPTGRIDSAPKDFEVYGMKDISKEKVLLGKFFFDKNGESTQTFLLPIRTDDLYQSVEMHVLSNWGQAEYTCLYRFRVHGKLAST